MSINLPLLNELLVRSQTELVDKRYLRHYLLNTIEKNSKILEIGAGGCPLCNKDTHPNYRILDFYSTDEVAQHFVNDYGLAGAKDTIFPTVDFVCKDGQLANAVGTSRFDLVFSSHAIEHQPCLVNHLQQIDAILADDGMVAFIVPEKNHTFDVLRQLSTTGEVLTAYHAGRLIPRGAEVFEYYSRHVTLNACRKVTPQDDLSFLNAIHSAYENFKRLLDDNSAYRDIHNWVFTPTSFVLIALELYMLGLSPFFPQAISNVNGNEFLCVLSRKPAAEQDELMALEEFRMKLCKDIYFGGAFSN
jgi:hypothetical protein